MLLTLFFCFTRVQSSSTVRAFSAILHSSPTSSISYFLHRLHFRWESQREREREREKVRLDGAWRSLIKSPNLALRLQLHTHTHTRSRLSLLTPASFPISPPNRDKWTRGLWLIHFCQGLYSTMPSGRSGRHGLQHVHDTHSLMQTLQRAPKTLP